MGRVLVDLCTLGNAYYSMAHAHNGDLKPEISMEFNNKVNSMKQVTIFEEGRMRKGVGLVVLVSTIS